MAVLFRRDSGGEAIANGADIGVNAPGYRQQISVLGDEGGDQVLERRSFPVAHDAHDRVDQRSQQSSICQPWSWMVARVSRTS